ncbi:sensor histidine kinase [Actinacidiphila bryophytorum]|uniref:histidine kinase n=1 Tax=Actinacidiphila bryophytorum TaxID=1436133 RepID=A0A9W4MCU4_9ACTN|nr:sensor histidine kinase [Actinacidiphila bryophytorum]MBM9435891.1 sensor domain-containing protein [Actinacidiphila bryophytorum]MBN6547147.1 sensor domain-containing protein [Actinacidiphila bryophytorum]CAG7649693.1 Histidine kinase [Actinacidiphila bryophytorum]
MRNFRTLRRAFLRARRDTGFVAAGIPLHLALASQWVWGVTIVLKANAWAVVPIPFALFLVGIPTLTAVQRHRCRALLGVDVPRPAPTPERRWPRRAVRWLSSARTWRQVGYHLLLGPLLAAVELLVLAAWAAAVAGVTAFGYASALPVYQTLLCTAGGVVLLCVAPWLAGATARTEARLAPALLGPSRNERLRRRVEHLAESRTDLIEAVDSERRRIERDLHDGTQQRLVSLAVNLGLARATLTDLPDDARTAIDEAHREAKEAIAELNDLVRGLHPAVLEDRGLDAALSGLAARVPLPVGVRVDIGERAAPVVESVAYFVVSEALANVTKHARATRAEVTVERIGKLLRVNVTDDGSGGADASAGSGLNGLARRVGSVDGTFRVSSPAGGPTTLIAELPCEL